MDKRKRAEDSDGSPERFTKFAKRVTSKEVTKSEEIDKKVVISGNTSKQRKVPNPVKVTAKEEESFDESSSDEESSDEKVNNRIKPIVKGSVPEEDSSDDSSESDESTFIKNDPSARFKTTTKGFAPEEDSSDGSSSDESTSDENESAMEPKKDKKLARKIDMSKIDGNLSTKPNTLKDATHEDESSDDSSEEDTDVDEPRLDYSEAGLDSHDDSSEYGSEYVRYYDADEPHSYDSQLDADMNSHGQDLVQYFTQLAENITGDETVAAPTRDYHGPPSQGASAVQRGPVPRTFHPFVHLPAELRLKIWALSRTEPHILNVKYQHEDFSYRVGRTFYADFNVCEWVIENKKNPFTSLAICQESRYEALKSRFFVDYEVIHLTSDVSQRAWFNFNIDTYLLNTSASNGNAYQNDAYDHEDEICQEPDWENDESDNGSEKCEDHKGKWVLEDAELESREEECRKEEKRSEHHEEKELLENADLESREEECRKEEERSEYHEQKDVLEDAELESREEMYRENDMWEERHTRFEYNDEQQAIYRSNARDLAAGPPRAPFCNSVIKKLRFLAISQKLWVLWPFADDWGSEVTSNGCPGYGRDQSQRIFQTSVMTRDFKRIEKIVLFTDKIFYGEHLCFIQADAERKAKFDLALVEMKSEFERGYFWDSDDEPDWDEEEEQEENVKVEDVIFDVVDMVVR